MSIHLLSVLGTSLYEPVKYRDDEFVSSVQEFIQLALVEKFRDELTHPDARITIFLTKKAEADNWTDRLYTKREEEGTFRFKSDHSAIQKDAIKRGLLSQFNEQFPELAQKIKSVEIPEGKKEAEIWGTFNCIYKELRAEDEVIFDITHSFRSIPMLAITAINYAKILTGCSLKGIYYGAYESGEKNDANGEVLAPIFNLTVYNEILDWTNAANVFMKYGSASMMSDVFNQKVEKASIEQKKAWAPIKNVVKSAANLSDAIQTGRGIGASALSGRGGKADYSIQAAVQNYAVKCEELPKEQHYEMQALYPLVAKTQEAYGALNQEVNYKSGLATVEWCIKHKQIQQGYTALEESIKTYLCHKYNLDEIAQETREGIISMAINYINHVPRQKGMDPEEIRTLAKSNYEQAFKCEYKSDCKEVKRTPDSRVLEVISSINMDLAKLAGEIKKLRNDINHFGMRKDANGSERLRSELKNKYDKLIGILEAIEADPSISVKK